MPLSTELRCFSICQSLDYQGFGYHDYIGDEPGAEHVSTPELDANILRIMPQIVIEDVLPGQLHGSNCQVDVIERLIRLSVFFARNVFPKSINFSHRVKNVGIVLQQSGYIDTAAATE